MPCYGHRVQTPLRNTIKDGQIVMRPRHNVENHAALSFSKTKDLAGGNIKKEMRSTNTGVKPYKLLISDVGRLVVTDSNGQNMVMRNNFPTTYTDYDLQYFFQSTHGVFVVPIFQIVLTVVEVWKQNNRYVRKNVTKQTGV